MSVHYEVRKRALHQVGTTMYIVTMILNIASKCIHIVSNIKTELPAKHNPQLCLVKMTFPAGKLDKAGKRKERF